MEAVTAADGATTCRKRPVPVEIAEDSSDYDCPICHELLVEPVTGICGHQFCKHCLEKWRAANATSSCGVVRCPECRGVICPSTNKNFGVCRLLERMIQRQFAEEYARRLAEVQQARQQEEQARQQQVDHQVLAVQSMMANSLASLRVLVGSDGHPPSLPTPGGPILHSPGPAMAAQQAYSAVAMPSALTQGRRPPTMSQGPLAAFRMVPHDRTHRPPLAMPPAPPPELLDSSPPPLCRATTEPAPSSPPQSHFSAMSSLFSAALGSHMLTGGSTMPTSPTHHGLFVAGGPTFGPPLVAQQQHSAAAVLPTTTDVPTAAETCAYGSVAQASGAGDHFSQSVQQPDSTAHSMPTLPAPGHTHPSTFISRQHLRPQAACQEHPAPVSHFPSVQCDMVTYQAADPDAASLLADEAELDGEDLQQPDGGSEVERLAQCATCAGQAAVSAHQSPAERHTLRNSCGLLNAAAAAAVTPWSLAVAQGMPDHSPHMAACPGEEGDDVNAVTVASLEHRLAGARVKAQCQHSPPPACRSKGLGQAGSVPGVEATTHQYSAGEAGAGLRQATLWWPEPDSAARVPGMRRHSAAASGPQSGRACGGRDGGTHHRPACSDSSAQAAAVSAQGSDTTSGVTDHDPAQQCDTAASWGSVGAGARLCWGHEEVEECMGETDGCGAAGGVVHGGPGVRAAAGLGSVGQEPGSSGSLEGGDTPHTGRSEQGNNTLRGFPSPPYRFPRLIDQQGSAGNRTDPTFHALSIALPTTTACLLESAKHAQELSAASPYSMQAAWGATQTACDMTHAVHRALSALPPTPSASEHSSQEPNSEDHDVQPKGGDAGSGSGSLAEDEVPMAGSGFTASLLGTVAGGGAGGQVVPAVTWHDLERDLPMRQAVVRRIVETLLSRAPGYLRPERCASFQSCVARIEQSLYASAGSAREYCDPATLMSRCKVLRKQILEAQARASAIGGALVAAAAEAVTPLGTAAEGMGQALL